jgi:hypothetical protein
MTDENPAPVPAFDAESWLAKERAHAELAQSIRPTNKAVLFDALAGAGIAVVVVTFDGYGDSGQIENIEVQGESTELPTVEIEFASVAWGDLEVRHHRLSVREALEALAYALLEQTHCGWENNEGAYGEFTFDIADRTVTLDYNERIESSEYTQHIF